MIEVKVIEDSVNPSGQRLTTIEATYPRYIHSQVMTHRMFSRNAQSSRAIPTRKLIEEVENNPVIPYYWGSNKPGMQPGEELDTWVEVPPEDGRMSNEGAWRYIMNEVIGQASCFADAGYSKEIVNRLLEPFAHITVLITATEWDNFFALRDHGDAQHEIQELAAKIKVAMFMSRPTELKLGEYHLPYIRDDENLGIHQAIICSVARCARVSYLTHGGERPTVEEDEKLFDRLVGSKPLHASPLEHIASSCSATTVSNNFRGFLQYRQVYEVLP